MTVPLWLELMRITTLVLLAVQAGLTLRVVHDHPSVPRVVLIPAGCATLAFYWEQVEHWSNPALEWHASPLAISYSLAVMVMARPLVKLRK